MKSYLEKEPWAISEKGFHAANNKVTESIFSLGNGYMGHRGMFEETYSGESLQGSYLAGVYYPDKTRVGWWKNGYPEYFAKVLNSVYWIGVDIYLDGKLLDLAEVTFIEFERKLDMKMGSLSKSILLETPKGYRLMINSIRFCSLAQKELGALQYEISSENFSGKLAIHAYLDSNVLNEDSNYDHSFWEDHKSSGEDFIAVSSKTLKTEFYVKAFAECKISGHDNIQANTEVRSGYASNNYEIDYRPGTAIIIEKRVLILSNFYHEIGDIDSTAKTLFHSISDKTYDELFDEHTACWEERWKLGDIIIDGDISAQQAIRFNIFQLHQTYTGEDDRLNIGPKGFTGEKYGGSTYWDTEAYCLPFYLSTAPQKVSRNLLVYRYKHLQKAVENAEKLGFTNGAALYPMVTITGEECHNEWEITFEEIHRNGAIAYAIFDYINYTGDQAYLQEHGLEVLIAIARFWAQRVNWSEDKQAYVMLGVTGPNEYENNVNNNWYTNYIAKWCLAYAKEALGYVGQQAPVIYNQIIEKTNFKPQEELEQWDSIIEKMYLPYDDVRKVFLQQDGFLDKELMSAAELAEEDRPINQKWSWDRILRSCFIKQADVLQGLYFFEDHFDLETVKRNFDFYEPMTVHESSLSPCVHNILACKLNKNEKAYEMYLRTARLDLDDYNNDTEDGLHITSMGGTWMSVVKGFGGMRVKNGKMSFAPNMPEQWSAMEFKLRFNSGIVHIKVDKNQISLHNNSNEELSIGLYHEELILKANQTIIYSIKGIK